MRPGYLDDQSAQSAQGVSDERRALRAPTARLPPHRRLLYRVWRLLPPLGQRLAYRVAAPSVSLGACALIRDARGRVLVAHHTYRRQAWGLPGGLVGTHEQPDAALARELREELGITARIGPLLHAAIDVRHLTLYYGATITGTPCPDGVEIDQLRYVTAAELASLVGEPLPNWLPYLTERKAS